jgi:hypothetical protein
LELLAHRGYWLTPEEKNALAAFERAFEHGWGAEIDVRDLDGELVVSHDTPRAGALPLAAVLDAHARLSAPGKLAINIKSDGLQEPLGHALAAADPDDWFLFDMSVPDALVSLKRRLPVFTRHSDVESVPAVYDESIGVWLDDFFGGFVTEDRIADHLAAGKRVAVVSPELHGRDHTSTWQAWREWGVWREPGVLLCTDHPAEAREVFA